VRDGRASSGNIIGMRPTALPALAHARAEPVSDRDVARFERLWQASYAAVHGHASRRVGAERADEVCAEVFLIAWRRLDELPADTLPWLLATSRNVIGTLWRGDGRRERLTERLEAEPAASGPDELELPDAGLQAALAVLTELDRELVLLVYWEGLKPARAAKALGLAPATARTRLWRARRQLGRLLTHEEGPR
jgi:RNA polymerase sigma factor (sigma-70 family)